MAFYNALSKGFMKNLLLESLLIIFMFTLSPVLGTDFTNGTSLAGKNSSENIDNFVSSELAVNDQPVRIYFTYHNPGTDILIMLIYVLVSLAVFFILFKIHFFLGVIVLLGGAGLFVYDMVRYDADYENFHLKLIPLIMGAIVCWCFYKSTYGQD